MTRSAALLLACLAVALFAGCAPKEQQLPAVPWHDEREAREILRQRAEAVRTVSAEGLLTLERPDGESVRFDLAMAREGDQRVRLRAWKLGRAVFDLTMNPEGVWLLTPDDPSLKQKVRSAGVSARQLVESWNLFNGELFRSDDSELVDRGGTLVYRGANITCEIDRRTLTPRRYVLSDDNGRQRFRLDLSDYRDVAGTPFAHRYVATSDEGRIIIALREAELNTDLPPDAFRPPRRAEKLP
jgi:outer membrane lipoprotein-sorting protein